MRLLPVQPQERIESIDIIRGFALFGIFLVNVPAFQWPALIANLYMFEPKLSASEQWVRLFFDVFIQAKFFTIFSFLFGLGFYLFMSRAEEKGYRIYPLFIRRVTILALFGLLHLVFFWYGDILLNYALTGILLIFFYKRKIKTILTWIFILFVLTISLLLVNFLIPQEVAEEAFIEQQEKGFGKLEEATFIYQNAGFMEWITYRFENEVTPVLVNLPFAMPFVFLMFLLGLYAGKRRVFENFSKNRLFIQRVWGWCLAISLPFAILIVLLHLEILDFGFLTKLANQAFVNISGFFLSLFYISSFLLLLQKDQWKELLKPFGFAGRMALTNYITQTLIGVGLFTGMGLYGDVNLVLGIFICCIVFPLQIVFSFYWLKRYRFGPLEWIWRSLTYGGFQPMEIRGKSND